MYRSRLYDLDTAIDNQWSDRLDLPALKRTTMENIRDTECSVQLYKTANHLRRWPKIPSLLMKGQARLAKQPVMDCEFPVRPISNVVRNLIYCKYQDWNVGD